MKRTVFSKLALVSVLSLAVLGSPAFAQRGQDSAPGGFPGFGGGMPNMSGMMKMAARSGMIEPTMSNTLVLLNRNDVRAELGLSAKQKEDLDGQQEQIMQTMFSAVMTKVMARAEDLQSLRDLPEAERNEKIQSFTADMRGTVEVAAKGADKDIEKVLTKKQTARLKQLDMQWRGTLAAADPTLSETLKITPEQKPEIEKIVAEFREKQQKQTTGMFGGFGGQRGGGQGAPPDPSARQTQMAEMKKSNDKLREEQSKKILVLLSDEQKVAWQKMQGVKFRFRPHDD